MNKENTMALIRKYPRLYCGVNKPITENLMSFGFECGNGWFDLIDRLSAELIAHDPDAEAVQVKEKFGGLRFYTGGLIDGGYAIIGKYEDESYATCEVCGKEGSSRDANSYWIRTLCQECLNKREGRVENECN